MTFSSTNTSALYSKKSSAILHSAERGNLAEVHLRLIFD